MLSLLERTLAVRFASTAAAIRLLLDEVDTSDFTDWAALRIMDGGDRIRSATRAPSTRDSRDASWVQVRGICAIQCSLWWLTLCVVYLHPGNQERSRRRARV